MSALVYLQKTASHQHSIFPLQKVYELKVLPSELTPVEVREGGRLLTEGGTIIRLTRWAGYTEMLNLSQPGEQHQIGLKINGAPCTVLMYGQEIPGRLEGVFDPERGSSMVLDIDIVR